MSYKPITIQDWQKGVGVSPFLGFAKIVGLDIFRKPGIIQDGVRLDSQYTTVGAPSSYVNANGDQYVGTLGTNGSTGNFYKNGVQIFTTSGPVHDMVFLNDYIIISTSRQTLDAYGPLSAAPTYRSAWKTTMNTSVYGYKKMFVGRDNSIYIGNENQLASIFGTNGSFASWGLNTSISSSAIPNNRIITTICEYNRFVTIMTSGGANSQNSRVYFLDLFQADNTTRQFKLTAGTDIPERTCSMMINSNNRIYFFGNDTGTIYVTNQVSYSPIATIPARQLLQNYITYPNAVCQVNNEILWGVGGGFNSAYDTVYGIYGLREAALYTKNIISSGEYGQNRQVLIPMLSSIASGQYTTGWNDSATTTVDVAASNISLGFTSWVDSPMYEVGTAKNPRTFQTIELNFGTNLSAGQQIRVQYRTATNAPFITLKDFGFTVYGAVNSLHDKLPISSATNLQIRVLFDCSAAVYGSNIELQTVILS